MVGKAEKHVFQAELPKLDKSTGTFKYKGAHTKSALEQIAKENNGSYILKDLKINPETGVYQCRPVLTFENGIVTTILSEYKSLSISSLREPVLKIGNGFVTC